MKLLPGGSGLVWSTYMETCCSGFSQALDVTVDAAGNAHVIAAANEGGWPTTPDALQPTFMGPTPSADAALSKFDAFGESLVYSSWFGGPNGGEVDGKIALEGEGGVYVACTAYGPNDPVTPGAFQPTYAGNGDLVAAKFSITPLPWIVLGSGMAGAKDTPNLAGAGSLSPGSLTRLSIRGAAASAPSWLVAGFSHLDLPLLGGTLVPSPDALVPLLTQPSGAADLVFAWPPLPPGIEITFQTWTLDLGAPHGWSASNALEAHVP